MQVTKKIGFVGYLNRWVGLMLACSANVRNILFPWVTDYVGLQPGMSC